MNEALPTAIRAWNPWWAGVWNFPAKLVPRVVFQTLKSTIVMPHVKDIIGVRRSGKTTLLFQVIRDLIEDKVPPERVVFLNFNDVVINSVDFTTLLKSIYVVAPEFEYLFLDEVQEKQGWERWVTMLYETKKAKNIFVTGSTAALLSEDIGRLLTGRHVSFILFPFSFKETLFIEHWKSFDMAYLHAEIHRLNGYLEKYLFEGGFPEVYNKDPLVNRQIMTNLFNDIIARDVAARRSIDNEKLNSLAQYVMTNFTREFSLRKISAALNIHVDTVDTYLTLLERCFMIFKVPLYSYKQLHQFRENKKIYVIDNGLRNHVAFKTTKDLGKLAENAVFLVLKSQGKDIYYWKDGKHEVDFIVAQGSQLDSIIQVCWDLTDTETRKREVAGILAAAKTFNHQQGIILNRDTDGEEVVDGITIRLVPIACWLLSP